MLSINCFRAHVLHHSSAAVKIGNIGLARKIINVKHDQNDAKLSKLEGKVLSQAKLIKSIYGKHTLDNKTKQERITHIQAKLNSNLDKMMTVLDKQEKYRRLKGLS